MYCGKASDSGLIKRTRVISAVAIQWNRLLATGYVPSRPLMVSITVNWGRKRCGVGFFGRERGIESDLISYGRLRVQISAMLKYEASMEGKICRYEI